MVESWYYILNYDNKTKNHEMKINKTEDTETKSQKHLHWKTSAQPRHTNTLKSGSSIKPHVGNQLFLAFIVIAKM